MRHRWDVVGRKLSFAAQNRAQWRAWRGKTAEKLRELTGYNTMRRSALKPRITEEKDFGEYVRQRVEIQTEPGVVMPLFVLIPKNARPPFPVVIAPHGHVSGGKLAV